MMILKLAVLVVLVLSTLSLADGPQEQASELTPRGGLPNVGKKIADGQDVTVVWIGGSITQCGENGPHGYVRRMSDWLDETYPEVTFTHVNAGISGTGSDFGAKRWDRDVLAHQPDLVLIEFCVNDGDSDRTREMERMVHKTWLNAPATDLVIFYTLADRHLPDYKQGRLPFAASCHERVAAHYGIPTIGTAKVVADRVNAGQIEWSDFASDGCHPHEKGYGLFVEHLKHSLPTLFATGKPGKHELLKPLSPNFEVYPPKPQVEPFTAPAFTDDQGNRAKASYALPTIGKHWLGEPQFDNKDGKALWRLMWMDRKRAPIDDSCGLERTLWDGHEMEWFMEDNCFTGPGGQGLVHTKDGKGNQLCLAQKEAAVLLFVAPATGTYKFRVRSSGVGCFKSEDKVFSLQIAHFPWGKEKGRSLAFFKAPKPETKKLQLDGTVEMTAGEELAFIPATNAPWFIGGGWQHFVVEIGYYPKD